jgi:hypothetical protein
MARLLGELERDSPNLRAVMLSALKNVSTTHLLDPRLLGRPAIPEDVAGGITGVGPRRLPVLS